MLKLTFKRLFAVSGSAVLLLGTCSPAVADPLPDRFQVLSGQLLSEGTPVAGDVTVLAWPTAESLAKLKKGQHASVVVVQQLRTGNDGRFGVSVDPAELPAGYATGRGQVDLEVLMATGGRQASWFTSAMRRAAYGSTAATRGKVVSTWSLPTVRREGVPLRFDLSGGSLDFDGAKSKKNSVNQLAVASVGARSQVARAGQSAVTPMETCVVTADKTYTNIKEEFASIFAWSGAKGTVDFNTGSDHTLGIALGSSSGWKQSGTGSISTSAGATVTGVVNKVAVNKVNYRDYYNSCTPYTYRKPLSFYALLPSASFGSISSYKFSGGCATYLAGASVWKKQGTNVTYSAGVPLGVANVSAQSGWNNETKLTWTITEKTKICGSKSSGWVDSPEVDARKA